MTFLHLWSLLSLVGAIGSWVLMGRSVRAMLGEAKPKWFWIWLGCIVLGLSGGIQFLISRNLS